MESKTYYGEYSLKHWIELILKQNIILPEYQRYFVWEEKRTKKLIESIKNDEFVPPVTIGFYEKEGEKVNYIIDGQQRLTSILLSYLGKFPNKSFKASGQIGYASERDEKDDPDDNNKSDDVKEWNLSQLTKKGRTKIDILKEIDRLEKGNYDNIPDIDEKFINEKYLGFSYIVPRSSDDDRQNFYSQQKKFYSSIFRNINIQGMALKDMESRKSLYFLDDKMKDFFDPEFQNKMVSNNGVMDFTRYVALLSNYYHSDKKRVGYRYSKRMSELYANFIYFIVNDERYINDDTADLFNPLPENIINGNYKTILEGIGIVLEKLFIIDRNEPTRYPSIIDLDVRLFGLIDVYIFQEKEISLQNSENIKREIDNASKLFKDTPLHERNPNALKYLKERIEKSIEIYRKYVK